LVVDECDVVGRRSFRGTWELTPPEPDWAGRRCRGGRLPYCPGRHRTCWRANYWVRRPAIRAPADGRTDWFTGVANAPPGFWPASGSSASRPRRKMEVAD